MQKYATPKNIAAFIVLALIVYGLATNKLTAEEALTRANDVARQLEAPPTPPEAPSAAPTPDP